MEPSRVSIIATTDEGTRAALEAARRLVPCDARSPIVLLVPHVLSASVVREGPAGTARAAERYRGLVRAAGVDAVVRLCHCQGYRDVLRWMLDRSSPVVIGGRQRRWWPTAAQRMMRELERKGHRVVFADVG